MSTPATALDVRPEIEAANRAFVAMFARGDAAALAAQYTASGQVLPAHKEVVSGTAAITHFWAHIFGMGLTEATLATQEVEAHDDTAYEVGRYTMMAGDQVADAGKYVVIWKREGGAWRIHRDIWTTDLPAA